MYNQPSGVGRPPPDAINGGDADDGSPLAKHC
jgi:hypothetical protein